MHFVMYAFSNHVGVLHNVTPIDLLAQSVVLSDGVVAECLHKATRYRVIVTVNEMNEWDICSRTTRSDIA